MTLFIQRINPFLNRFGVVHFSKCIKWLILNCHRGTCFHYREFITTEIQCTLLCDDASAYTYILNPLSLFPFLHLFGRWFLFVFTFVCITDNGQNGFTGATHPQTDIHWLHRNGRRLFKIYLSSFILFRFTEKEEKNRFFHQTKRMEMAEKRIVIEIDRNVRVSCLSCFIVCDDEYEFYA